MIIDLFSIQRVTLIVKTDSGIVEKQSNFLTLNFRNLKIVFGISANADAFTVK